MFKFTKVFTSLLCVFFLLAEAGASMTCSRFLKHKSSDFKLKFTKEGLVDAYYKGKEVGYIQFDFDVSDASLSIDYMSVDHDFKRNGLSKILLAEALKIHPDTKIIKTSLTQTNENVFRLAQLSGLDFTPASLSRNKVFDAVKQTPAYQIRAALGFSKITYFVNEHYWVVLHVEKDDLTSNDPKP